MRPGLISGREKEIFLSTKLPDRLRGPPSLIQLIRGALPQMQNGRGMNVNTLPLPLVPTLTVNATIPLLLYIYVYINLFKGHKGTKKDNSESDKF